jgi:hypothetical protein
MLGIISDTHDNVRNILKAVEIFRQKKVDFVMHLGDIIAPATVKFFNGLNMKFIQGNCDGDVDLLKKRIEEIGGEFLGETAELEIKGKKIFLCHGKDTSKLDNTIQSNKYDYVLHGHTHKNRNEKIGKTRVVNPGAHYYGAENTIVLLDLEKETVEFVDVR